MECVDRGKLLGEFGLKTLKFLAGLRLISSLGGTMTTAVPFIIAPGGAVCDCCCCASLTNLGGRSLGALSVPTNLICSTLKYINDDLNI